jgi:hypothetical protein
VLRYPEVGVRFRVPGYRASRRRALLLRLWEKRARCSDLCFCGPQPDPPDDLTRTAALACEKKPQNQLRLLQLRVTWSATTPGGEQRRFPVACGPSASSWPVGYKRV